MKGGAWGMDIWQWPRKAMALFGVKPLPTASYHFRKSEDAHQKSLGKCLKVARISFGKWFRFVIGGVAHQADLMRPIGDVFGDFILTKKVVNALLWPP